MPWTSNHLSWLKDLGKTLKTHDGKDVKLFKFSPDKNEKSIMSAWSKHFRNHYCFDTEIDALRDGTGYSRKDYLLKTKFPSCARGLGPAIRAGDFAEILLADYLEYKMDHFVPRTRYGNKVVRDESSKGSDLIGFKLFDGNETAQDVLTIFEVKAQFSGQVAKARLQDAVDGSAKDELRKAESLNAIKQRLFDKQELDKAKMISRFQNPVGKPYKEQNGAAAFFNTNLIDEKLIKKTDASKHPNKSNLILIVISADNCMNIVNQLYQLAADEA